VPLFLVGLHGLAVPHRYGEFRKERFLVIHDLLLALPIFSYIGREMVHAAIRPELPQKSHKSPSSE
jgi:hypothetical protein